MKLIFRSVIIGWAWIVALTSAYAGGAVMFGLDRFDNPVQLPVSLCAYPGQVLRLQADVFEFGYRRGLPAEYFTWQLTHRYGTYTDIWSPAWSPYFGPFQRGQEPDAIYVTVPWDMGAAGRLEISTTGEMPSAIQIVDPRAYPSPRCFWTHPDVYLGG
jgi:hypothetical protein